MVLGGGVLLSESSTVGCVDSIARSLAGQWQTGNDTFPDSAHSGCNRILRCRILDSRSPDGSLEKSAIAHFPYPKNLSRDRTAAGSRNDGKGQTSFLFFQFVEQNKASIRRELSCSHRFGFLD
jgi:hypothetical protein